MQKSNIYKENLSKDIEELYLQYLTDIAKSGVVMTFVMYLESKEEFRSTQYREATQYTDFDMTYQEFIDRGLETGFISTSKNFINYLKEDRPYIVPTSEVEIKKQYYFYCNLIEKEIPYEKYLKCIKNSINKINRGLYYTSHFAGDLHSEFDQI